MRTAKPRTIAVWTLVALVGAAGWSVLALARGENVSAARMVAAALGSHAIAYRFYAKFIAHKVLKVDGTRATPAERLNSGIDFHPTDRRVLLGHHFAAIASAGPPVGPVSHARTVTVGRRIRARASAAADGMNRSPHESSTSAIRRGVP